MPQVSLYFDEKLTKFVTEGASRDKQSVSKFVSTILYLRINDQWPDQFIESLGSLSGSDLTRPSQPKHELDVPREKL